jgi:sugar lactone lactonase YvrE
MLRDTHRILPSLLLAVLVPATVIAQSSPASAPQPSGLKVRTVTDTLVGGVGGVAVDRSGAIYVATFGDVVYKVMPDGRVSVFATGLYGASGNAVDSRGRLLQSNFYGNNIVRIDRNGAVAPFAEGLQGPVGIAIDSADNLVVTNCRANTLSWVTAAGEVSTFADSPLLSCPNGITRGPDGVYYVVNFNGGSLLAVSPEGEVRQLATIPGNGNGHVAIARGNLYVTAFQSHRLYRVNMDGSQVTHVAGTGQVGEVDGPGLEASFSWPNGIATGPQGDRLYINDFVNRFPPTIEIPPVRKSLVRQVTLPSLSSVMLTALNTGGVDAMRAAHQAWMDNPATAGLFTERDVNALGYRLMGSGQMADAIVVFELNAEANPNSFNVYDSLAEAYMNSGDKGRAIEFYRKSLALNSGNTNATAMLEKLEAE